MPWTCTLVHHPSNFCLGDFFDYTIRDSCRNHHILMIAQLRHTGEFMLDGATFGNRSQRLTDMWLPLPFLGWGVGGRFWAHSERLLRKSWGLGNHSPHAMANSIAYICIDSSFFHVHSWIIHSHTNLNWGSALWELKLKHQWLDVNSWSSLSKCLNITNTYIYIHHIHMCTSQNNNSKHNEI